MQLSDFYADRITEPMPSGMVANFRSPSGMHGFAGIVHGATEEGALVVTNLAADTPVIVDGVRWHLVYGTLHQSPDHV